MKWEAQITRYGKWWVETESTYSHYSVLWWELGSEHKPQTKHKQLITEQNRYKISTEHNISLSLSTNRQ